MIAHGFAQYITQSEAAGKHPPNVSITFLLVNLLSGKTDCRFRIKKVHGASKSLILLSIFKTLSDIQNPKYLTVVS